MHLGDLHFGKIVNEFNMLEDQRYIMAQVIAMAKERRPDGIMLAGDIYDRNIPSAAAVEAFDEFLTALSDLDIPVFIVSGNHDSAERLNFGGRLLTSRKVYISCTKQRAMVPVRLEDAYGPVDLWLLPYMKTEDLSAALREMQPDTALRNVLVTHCFVLNGRQEPELSDSESPVYVGGVDGVDVSLFDAFDYVALGHLHKPQHVGRETVRYSGSWLKYSFSEAGRDKTVTFVRLGPKGDISVTQEPLYPLRDMRSIRGELEALMDPKVYTLGNVNDYLYVTLTDDRALLDPMQTLRSVYPNVMQISFERKTKENGSRRGATLENAAKKSEAQLFSDFFLEVTGSPLDKEREKLMEVVIHEAEKTDH